MKQFKLWQLVALTLLTVFGAVAATLLFLRSRDPALVAENYLAALRSDNPDAVYRYRAEHEEAASGITRDTFRTIWREMVSPVLKKVKFKDRVISSERLNDPVTQGVAGTILVLPDGTEYEWGASAWVTEDGPRIPLLWDTLSSTWVLDYVIANTEAYRRGEVSFSEAKLIGLRKNRARLEALGLKGMVAPSGKFMTFDQAELHLRKADAAFRRTLAERKRRQAGAEPELGSEIQRDRSY